jgi:hypothetical protein
MFFQKFDHFIGPKSRRTARRSGRSANSDRRSACAAPHEDRFSFSSAFLDRLIQLDHPREFPKLRFARLGLEHGMEPVELFRRDGLWLLRCRRR